MKIKDIAFKKTFLRKSKQTYGNEYLVTLKRKDGRRIQFHFHDGKGNDSSIGDFLYALFLDASSYEDDPTPEAFAKMWGYQTNDVKKVFMACKKQMERRDYFLDKEEQRELNNELEELGF